jgi:hypothetical protein
MVVVRYCGCGYWCLGLHFKAKIFLTHKIEFLIVPAEQSDVLSGIKSLPSTILSWGWNREGAKVEIIGIDKIFVRVDFSSR